MIGEFGKELTHDLSVVTMPGLGDLLVVWAEQSEVEAIGYAETFHDFLVRIGKEGERGP